MSASLYPLTIEDADLLCRCPECGDFCAAWETTEGDFMADCLQESCEDAGSTFPVLASQVRPFVPVLYRCYPHTDDDGSAEIRGFLTHNGEQEHIIVTHPESMKGETLEGFSDYIYLNEVEDCVFITEPIAYTITKEHRGRIELQVWKSLNDMFATVQEIADADDGSNADFFAGFTELETKMQTALEEYLIFEMNGGGFV
jgi:hypothetical protein